MLLPPLLLQRSVRAARIQVPWRELVAIGAGLTALLLAFRLYYGTAAAAVFCQAGRPQAVALVLVAAAVAAATRLRSDSFHVYSDDEFLALHTSRSSVYRGLDTLRACFGDAIHVYHSEVGLPGLRFRHGKVTDLAGLLSPEWLFREPRSFDRKCERDRPHAIFLPHKNYRTLNREITGGTCIAGYVRMVESSSSPLFVRADLVPAYRACARERGDPYAAR